MAIQPIDLQTMYSQMANVAQTVAHQQQGVQLNEAMQQQNIIQKNKEMSERVQKSADEQTQELKVKPDGHNGNEQPKGKKRQPKTDENKVTEEDGEKPDGIREEYLGRHINITR